MLWPLSVVLVANTNGRLAIPALAGLLVFKGTRRSKNGLAKSPCSVCIHIHFRWSHYIYSACVAIKQYS